MCQFHIWGPQKREISATKIILKSEQWSIFECSWCDWLRLSEQFVTNRRLINFMVTWCQLHLLSFIWINWRWMDPQVGFQIITIKLSSNCLTKNYVGKPFKCDWWCLEPLYNDCAWYEFCFNCFLGKLHQFMVFIFQFLGKLFWRLGGLVRFLVLKS